MHSIFESIFWSIFNRFLTPTSTLLILQNQPPLQRECVSWKNAFRSWHRCLTPLWCQLGSILAPKICQNPIKTDQNWSKMGQGGTNMGQDGPSWPQDGAKLVPRWVQDGPSWPQDGPSWPQDGPKTGQVEPKMGSKTDFRTPDRGCTEGARTPAISRNGD